MSEIFERDILDEIKESFLVYSEEVLTDRAVPAAEDGLLSAQRKILWTMEDFLKMNSKSKTKKCNAIIGSTLATAYFHGDQACYGVLCKMSQPYLMRYPLLIGQGSLGTQENNNMVASSRYTEAKPSIYADLMMNNFKKQVVPTKETYNGEFMEPVVLPGLFPNAICNGRQSIGVSMAHCSLPHCLTEVCDALIAMLKGEIHTVDDVLKYIKGPDFPLGGTVLNIQDVRTAFASGHSAVSLKVQGDYTIDGQIITFTSIPYRTYRNKIKEQIQANIDEFDTLLEDFDDESNIGANKLVFKVKKNVPITVALNRLFALTDLQTTLSYNMNYIVNGTPKLCSMQQLLESYLKHQENVLIKATEFDREKVAKRIRILEGLIAAVNKINDVIKLIQNSNNKQEAEKELINFLSITSEQATAILEMKLSRLTRIDKEELISELAEKRKELEELEKILNVQEYRTNKIINIITDLKNKYGDNRRTKLLNVSTATLPIEKYIEPEKCVVIMTQSGYIKRIPIANYRIQHVNTKGEKAQQDLTTNIIRTNTIDCLLVFTNQGNIYKLLVDTIPIGTNNSKGTDISSLIKLKTTEKPVLIYSIYKDTEAKYVLFVTRTGVAKKSLLSEFQNSKSNSCLQGIKIHDNDTLAAISLMKDEDILLLTNQGKSIYFDSTEIVPTGRLSFGRKVINLNDGDYVVSALPVRDKSDTLATFTKNGYGKRTSLSEFSKQKHNGKGFYCVHLSPNDCLMSGVLLSETDTVLVSGNQNTLRIAAKEIPIQKKFTVGNIIIKDNQIVSVSKV